jgi:3D (Asp-Asp-Asp) domain-containing protein
MAPARTLALLAGLVGASLFAVSSTGSARKPTPPRPPLLPEPVAAVLPAAPAPVAPHALADTTGARKLGSYQLTYYYLAAQKPTEVGGVPLRDPKGRVLARVSPRVRADLVMQGSGRLADGTLLNIAGNCEGGSPCFVPVDPTKPWGLGVRGHHLSPFRTIAVDPRRVPIGTAVYIAQLDGLRMPGTLPFGGFVHDGCVVAGDRGGNIKGRQFDFFVAARPGFLALRKQLGPRVDAFLGVARCQDRRPDWTPEELAVLRDGLGQARSAWTRLVGGGALAAR